MYISASAVWNQVQTELLQSSMVGRHATYWTGLKTERQTSLEELYGWRLKDNDSQVRVKLPVAKTALLEASCICQFAIQSLTFLPPFFQWPECVLESRRGPVCKYKYQDSQGESCGSLGTRRHSSYSISSPLYFANDAFGRWCTWHKTSPAAPQSHYTTSGKSLLILFSIRQMLLVMMLPGPKSNRLYKFSPRSYEPGFRRTTNRVPRLPDSWIVCYVSQ